MLYSANLSMADISFKGTFPIFYRNSPLYSVHLITAATFLGEPMLFAIQRLHCTLISRLLLIFNELNHRKLTNIDRFSILKLVNVRLEYTTSIFLQIWHLSLGKRFQLLRKINRNV